MSKRNYGPGVLVWLWISAMDVVFLAGGLYVHRAHTPYPDGLSAQGSVTDVVVSKSSKGGKQYNAVYTFTTADGRTVSFNDTGSTGGPPDIGTRVDISYPADSPEQARRVSGFDWGGWFFVLVGSLILVIGLGNALRQLTAMLPRRKPAR